MNAIYRLENVSANYGRLTAVRDVSLTILRPEFIAIAGPNGAGKSTLLNVMAGLRTFESGRCLLKSRDINTWGRKELARSVSVVPQSVRIEFPFTAEQVVLMGRTPFADAMFESSDDVENVRRAMEMTDTLDFRERDFRSLSGGERQRVIVASALAQTPEVLLLDEPTTWLDIQHQISLYTLLQTLAKQGTLVISITHDLNLAAGFADRVVLLSQGAMVGDGTPDEVFQRRTIHDVFRVDTVIGTAPGGRPWIYYVH